MSLNYTAFGGGLVGTKTAAAGTPWLVLIPPYVTPAGAYAGITRIAQIQVTQGNTANTLYLLRPIGRTTAAAASNTSVNTVTLTADPAPVPGTYDVQAGDYIAIGQGALGPPQLYKVSAWNSTSLVVTLTVNCTANVAIGNKVWYFGQYTGVNDPVTGTTAPGIPTTVNTTTTFTAGPAGFAGAVAGDPLLLYNPNATGASTLNLCEYAYTLE